MAKKSTNLTPEQINELKNLLVARHKKDQSLSELSREHPEYSYKAIKYWRKIFENNPDYTPKIYQTMDVSVRIKTLLIGAKENNQSLADILRNNPDLNMNLLTYWNRVFGILPIKAKKSYTIEQKYEILKYAAEHGVMEASRIYDINNVIITEWNNIYKIFSPKLNPAVISLDMRIKILSEVQNYNISNATYSGVSVVSEKYGINHRSIYAWNKELNIFKPKFKARNIRLSSEEIEYIINESEYFTTISELARTVGRSKTTVKNILTHHLGQNTSKRY